MRCGRAGTVRGIFAAILTLTSGACTPSAREKAQTKGDATRFGDAGNPANVRHVEWPKDAAVDEACAHLDAAKGPGCLPKRAYEWVAILGTGQSLSVGVEGTPMLSLKQPYANLKLVDRSPLPHYKSLDDALALVPLTAPIRRETPGLKTGPYPNNIFGETPDESMANQISQLSFASEARDYTTLHSVVGESGRSIKVIQKNGTGEAYAASLFEARAFAGFAAREHKSLGYGAIVFTHGEADSASETYEDDVHRLWTDYNVDLPQITGQTTAIPILVSQQCTLPANDTETSRSTVAEWRLGVDYPGDLICTGPKYQYEYASDGLHLNAPGYVRLGEKYAEVYWAITEQGLAWQPLQPTAIVRAGATITVTMHVPNPPLSWDLHHAPPHQSGHTEWAKGNGFEVRDADGAIAISSVAIVRDAVVITLARTPTRELTVGYAMYQDAPNVTTGGLASGRHGLLRDSDPFVGRDAETIACRVIHDSATITAATSGGFAAHALYEVVTGGALGSDVVTIARPARDAFTLSAPYTGPSGIANLTFAADQRNYLVQFQEAVP